MREDKRKWWLIVIWLASLVLQLCIKGAVVYSS